MHWDGALHSRMETAVTLLADPDVIAFLVDSIRGADGDVVRATNAINEIFQMPNDFPIFMVRAGAPTPSGLLDLCYVPFLALQSQQHTCGGGRREGRSIPVHDLLACELACCSTASVLYTPCTRLAHLSRGIVGKYFVTALHRL